MDPVEGGVALDPGQRPGFGLQFPVDAVVPSLSWMNRFRLIGAFPAMAFWALVTCSSMPRKVRRARSCR